MRERAKRPSRRPKGRRPLDPAVRWYEERYRAERYYTAMHGIASSWRAVEEWGALFGPTVRVAAARVPKLKIREERKRPWSL